MGPSTAPVLAVAQDALDSQDALQLWSVFSKCKDSLRDGRRLENISWRLAFRDVLQNRLQAEGPWPPTPESVCSDSDSGRSKSSRSADISSSSAATSPFFRIAPTSRESLFCPRFRRIAPDDDRSTQRRLPPCAPQGGLSAI
ncbi:hypothetical protein DFH06DRAFT_1009825 [Mycena polygramma]|nr:hypothetical protein DFH06DRAFT_1009825 [Mycena polygramma]